LDPDRDLIAVYEHADHEQEAAGWVAASVTLDPEQESFTVEFPTGSGNRVTLQAAADELSKRLVKLFLPGEGGERAQGERPFLGLSTRPEDLLGSDRHRDEEQSYQRGAGLSAGDQEVGVLGGIKASILADHCSNSHRIRSILDGTSARVRQGCSGRLRRAGSM
jgi:hypothetical protein